jgi:urease accessory protein
LLYKTRAAGKKTRPVRAQPATPLQTPLACAQRGQGVGKKANLAMTDEWLIWQLVDSAFPSGGFAHSGGLEAAFQADLVRDAPRLAQFIEAQLSTAAHGAAPFMLAAHRASASEWSAVDEACDAFLTNHVTNRASRAQGTAFIGAAAKIFGEQRLIELREYLRSGKRYGHFAPVFGVAMAAMGMDEPRACRLLMFFTVRAAVSSAVRLGIVGPLEGQSIQRHAAPAAERWADAAERIGEHGSDAAAQVAPMLELLAASHDRLYSRLFQS